MIPRVLILLLATISLSAAEPGKVALVGESYANYELKVIVNRVLVSSADEEYVYSPQQSTIPWESLDEYAAIIASTKLAEEATAEQNERLRRWVEGGGHLIIIHQAPRWLDLSWAGLRGTAYQRESLACEIRQPEHPLVAPLVDAEGPWMANASIVARYQSPMENLIGTDEFCLVGSAAIGKGAVVYLGHEVFRLRSRDLDPTESWIGLLRRAVRRAEPLTLAHLQAAQLAKREAPLLLWTREWQRGEPHGPRFVPPLPEPHEIVDELRIDLAIGEVESLQLNLTPTIALQPLAWEIETGDFPASGVELLIQDRPDTIPWPKAPELAQEAPYWLLPPRHVRPLDDPRFAMPEPGEPRILWLRLRTHDVTPGTYTLVLRLQGPDLEPQVLPVEVTVHPVQLPRRRLITLAPGGTMYGNIHEPSPARRFMANLQDHGVEWGVMSAIRPSELTHEGQPLDRQWFRDHQQAVLAGEPMLGFDALDPWFDMSLDHGLVYLRLHSAVYYLESMIRRVGYDEEQQAATRLWFRRQFGNYLRSKGYRRFVVSKGDELSPEALREEWMPWANEIQAADWRCTSAFSWGIKTENYQELVSMMAPYVGLWTLNRQLAPRFQADRAGGAFELAPDASIQPTLHWNDIPLIEAGEVLLAVEGPTACLEAFQEQLRQVLGSELTFAQEPRVILHFEPDSSRAPATSHRLYQQQEGDTLHLTLALGSQVPPELAVARLSAFLKAEGAWLRH